MKATELLAALRQDHPELHQIPDRELLNAGMQDMGIHPTQMENDLPNEQHWTGQEEGVTSLAPEDIAARGGATAAGFLRQSGQTTQQAIPGMFGTALGGLAKGVAAVIPQTSGEVETQAALPFVTKGLGAGVRAFASTEPGSAAMQILSKIPSNLIQEVAKAPEILNRYLPIEQAGQVMNDFFGQFGLKSGSAALAQAAKESGEAAPTLGSFKKVADSTIQAINNEPAMLAKMQSNSNLMQNYAQKIQELKAQYPEFNSLTPTPAEDDLSPLANRLREYQSKNEELHQAFTPLVKENMLLQKQLPNAQDALIARQYLSKITAKQALQSAENQVVAPVAEANKDLVDNWLGNKLDEMAAKNPNIKPIDVPGYGTINKADQVRQIYHEAKVGERFESFWPQNRNMTPDALRPILGLMAGKGIPFLQSPVLQGAALGLGGTPGAMAGGAANTLQNLFTSQEPGDNLSQGPYNHPIANAIYNELNR